MEQAPKWLPYRVRNKIDQWRINWALRGMDRVPPMRADDADDADAEVFTLVCKRDLRLGALALKSLLHHRGTTRLCATVIDDGSLSQSDIAWLDRQIPNLRWQKNRDPQVLDHPLMKRMPMVSALYTDSSFPFVAKYIHPCLLNRTERVVLVDTDTAFFRSPDRLLDFCAGRTTAPLYLHDHQDESKVVPAAAKAAFDQLIEQARLPDRRFRLNHWMFNAGLLAFKPAQFDVEIGERYLAWLKTIPQSAQTGQMSIWFGPWTREQTIYLLMFGSGPEEAQPLGDDYWLGGAEDRVFNHFLRFYLVRKQCLDMLRGLIERLAREVGSR